MLEVQTLAAAIEGMDEGMWITDANGVVLRHNEALRAILGTDQELVGQRPLFLVRRTELHDAVLRACREGVTSKVEVSMDAPRSKTLEVHIAPLGGSLPGSAAVFRDVTELQAAGAGPPGLRGQRRATSCARPSPPSGATPRRCAPAR